jgi:N-hydroxyarylamine O-acetyltransferase
VRQGGWELGLRLGPDGGTWELSERDAEGRFQILHRTTEEPQHAADVLVANHFTATHPSSPFVRQVVAIRKDETERLTLAGRELTVGRPDGTAEKRTLSGDEVVAALREDFRIPLDASDAARIRDL